MVQPSMTFSTTTTITSTATPAHLPLALNDAPPPSIISSSTWTFTQGFVLGQASFLILVGVFIKYVVFENAEKNRQRKLDRGKRPPLSRTNVPSPTSMELMEKVGYDMASHASESGDFLNVLLAQILQGYRDDLLGAGGEEGARRRVESWLNPVNSALSWLDPISVTSLNLGNSYPLLSNARIRPADGQGGIRLEVDIDYSDSLHLSLATSLLVNFPLPKFAVLPVALGVELVGVGGTLSIRVHNPPGSNRQQHVHMSLLPDFHLNVKTTSLLGSRAKLQDIPKLEQLVVARLRAVIHDKLVWPRYVEFSLPRLRGIHVEPVPTSTPQAAAAADLHKVKSDGSPSLHITTPSVNVIPQPRDGVASGTSPTSRASLSPTSRQIRMPADFRGQLPGGQDVSTTSVHGFAAPHRAMNGVDGFARGADGVSSVVDITEVPPGVNSQMRYRGTPSMTESQPTGLATASHMTAGHANGPSILADGREGRVGALNARNSRAVTGHA